MNTWRRRSPAWCKAALVTFAAGSVLATTCTSDQVKAVVTGIQVVTSQLNQDDDISFGDWLASEIDD